MLIKLKYDTQEEIPEGYSDLYEERDGAWVLAGVEGLQTTENVTRLEGALTKERNDHRETKTKLRAFDGLDPDTVHEDADELRDLRAQKEAGELAGGDAATEERVEQLVQSRIARLTAPLERELATVKEERDADRAENGDLKAQISSGKIATAIRVAAEKAKVAASAVEDVVALGSRLFDIEEDGGAIVTRDHVGVTPSITPDLWLAEVKENKPHWWPVSVGGGANGGDGGGTGSKNPWARANWNLTDQGMIVREQGLDKAKQMAKSVGSKVGATRPPEERRAAQ